MPAVQSARLTEQSGTVLTSKKVKLREAPSIAAFTQVQKTNKGHFFIIRARGLQISRIQTAKN